MSLWEMSNLTSEDTGIKGVVIWVSAGKKAQPQIKVFKGSEISLPGPCAVITVTTPPKLLKGKVILSQRQLDECIRFVETNKVALIQYWNQQISTKQFIMKVQAVGKP